MADISNKKYFAFITDQNAKPTYSGSWETAENPVNPPAINGGNLGGLGTTPKLAIWTSENTLGDSAVQDDGSTVFIDTRELRVNTINNLGVSATNFLVPDATGVFKLRTTAQVKSDLGVATIPIPDGLVQVGGAIQTGNDIEYDTDWIWRESGVEYSLLAIDTITFPAAAAGNIRIDYVVGNTSGGIQRVAGTEVLAGNPVVGPSIPANTIGLQEVFVVDTGIDTITDFTISTFVRYDINTQGLVALQRKNARDNIQTISKDTDDSRTGKLTNTGKVGIIDTSAGGTAFTIQKNAASASNNLLELYSFTNRVFRFISAGNAYFNKTAIIRNTADTASAIELSTTGRIFQSRSGDSDESVRRDELGFNYLETIATDGTINNLSINDGTKLIIFTLADNLTGVVPVTTNTGRMIRIYASGTTLTIEHEDVLSSANNRFSIGSDLTINDGECYSFIYILSRWRRSL